tara:strand:- start:35 stop:595 length:561 start_codon:yes stop_codon:yes gene_type:complete
MSMYKFKFENGDVIEMKAIKYSEFASEETNCYQAKIYLNGKAWIEVDNDGRGGADRQSPINMNKADRWDKIKDINERLKVEHAPEIYRYEGDDGKLETATMKVDLEIWCGNQIGKWLSVRRLKNLMRTKLLFVKNKTKPDGLFSLKKTKFSDGTAKNLLVRYPDGMVLNSQPIDEITEYCQANRLV